MKVKLKSNWTDDLSGVTHKCGSIVHVSDSDGQLLLGLGHEQVSDDLKATKAPELYDAGCIPTLEVQPKTARQSAQKRANDE